MRAEFIVLQEGEHPLYTIEQRGPEALTQTLKRHMVEVATAFFPRSVRYRSLDLKSNEYRGLLGGEKYEPVEANPMLGRRGAYSYTRHLQPAFCAELAALKSARDDGLTNLSLLLPYVRTVGELVDAKAIVNEAGLFQDPSFSFWMMAEVPANILLYSGFAPHVDGMSVGGNDLKQLVLGIDRDSPELAAAFDGLEPAVLVALEDLADKAKVSGMPLSFCGDDVSRSPQIARAVYEAGYDSLVVSADAVPKILNEFESVDR